MPHLRTGLLRRGGSQINIQTVPKGAVMPVQEHLSPLCLRSVRGDSRDDIAYTFIDYEVDPAGFAESLTWSQLDGERGMSPRVVAVRVCR